MKPTKLITLTTLTSVLALSNMIAEETKTDVNYYEDYVDTTKSQYENSDEDEADSDEDLDDEDDNDDEDAPEIADATDAKTMSMTKAPQTATVDMAKLSEAFGNYLGKNIKNSGIEFNIDQLITGIRNGSQDKPSPLTQEEYEAMMIAVQQQAVEKLSGENLKAAQKFMTENAAKPNVVEVIPGKLQYTIIKEGSGATVQNTNTPLINYSGKFIDGTVFSSSDETGGAITIPLSHTIPGFQKGITGMKEGEKRRLFIHPDQGYGASAGHLPPNSLLIFDIEVVKADNAEEADDGDNDDDEGDDDNKATPEKPKS